MNKLQELVAATKEEYRLSEDQSLNIVSNIREEIRNYVNKNNLKSLVVGVSGGLDSAVVAALCQEKFTGVPLIGVHIPLSTSDEHSEQADWVGEMYCTSYSTFTKQLEEDSIDLLVDLLDFNETSTVKLSGVLEDSNTAIRQGNFKARIRMIALYDMARLHNGIVLSTDNYSEYLAGFWTLHGDVGDFGPIQYVYKGLELPYIASALGVREDIITQPPSDGLGVTDDNTDEAQLGCDYPTFDTIMVGLLGSSSTTQRLASLEKKNPTINKVINRHTSTTFKRDGDVNPNRSAIGLRE